MSSGRFDSKTRIRFRLVDGVFRNYFTGDPIELTPDTVGEIVFDIGGVSVGLAKELRKEEIRNIAPANSILLLGFGNASDHLDELFDIKSLVERPQWRMCLSQKGLSLRYAQLNILNELNLLMRGTKLPKLMDCDVRSAHLDSVCVSLNQAYTLLSMRYEPNRRSHSGNVFRNGFVVVQDRLVSLDLLRDQREAYFQTAMYSTASNAEEAEKWLHTQLMDKPQTLADLLPKLQRAWKGGFIWHDEELCNWLESIKAPQVNGIYYPAEKVESK